MLGGLGAVALEGETIGDWTGRDLRLLANAIPVYPV